MGLTGTQEEFELYTRAQQQVESDASDYASLQQEHNGLLSELGSMKAEVPKVKREVQELRAVIAAKRAQLEALRKDTGKLDAAAKADAEADKAAQEQLSALRAESIEKSKEEEVSEKLVHV